MIEFVDVNSGCADVFLEGKYVGHILRVAGGYQYRPKGTKKNQWGEVYPSMDKCKISLK